MESRKIAERTGAALALCAAMLMAPTAAAQSVDTDVAVFLTEVVEKADGTTEKISFWWSDAGEPTWTASDEVVFAALREAGVEPVQPQVVDISRIHRRPGISTENAAQLGALVQAERVLVGEVYYRVLDPVAPLGYPGVEARAEVDLVPVRDAQGVSLDRFTVRRQVFSSNGADASDLFEDAREVAGRALGDVMGQSLRRSIGEVGTSSEVPLLSLRNLERAENLEMIRERLRELDEVDDVIERWAAEGTIAVEIIPSDGDPQGVFDYVDRLLANHEFDGFQLIRGDSSVAGGGAEYWLEPEHTEFNPRR